MSKLSLNTRPRPNYRAPHLHWTPFLLIALLLAGCSLSGATLIKADYAPERGGVIAEDWNSWFSSKKHADEKASAIMRDYCVPGKYQVQSEAQVGHASSVDQWGGIHYDSNPQIKFVCEKLNPTQQSLLDCSVKCMKMSDKGKDELDETCYKTMCMKIKPITSSMFEYRAPIDIHYPHSPTFINVRKSA